MSGEGKPRTGARESLYSELPCRGGVGGGCSGSCGVRFNAPWVMVT